MKDGRKNWRGKAEKEKDEEEEGKRRMTEKKIRDKTKK